MENAVQDNQPSPPQDDGWNDFVQKNSTPANQNTTPIEQPSMESAHSTTSRDPNWDQFVGKNADLGKISDDLTQKVHSFLNPSPPPQTPSYGDEYLKTISNDLKSFRNKEDYRANSENSNKILYDAIVRPAVDSFMQSIVKPINEQFYGALGQIKEGFFPTPRTDEYGNVLPEELGETAVRGLNIAYGAAALENPLAAATGIVTGAGVQSAATPFLGHEEAQELGSEAGNAAFMMHAAMHGHPLNMLVRAKAAGVLDGEGIYDGTEQPTPEQAASMAAARSAVGEPKAATPPPNIHELANHENPEVMGEYRSLQHRQEFFRDSLTDMAEQRDKEVAENPPHAEELKALDEQIDKVTGKVGWVLDKLTKTASNRLADLQEQRASLQAQAETEAKADTEEMARMRQSIMENDYRLRDLAPEVNKAYAAAAEKVTPEEAKTVPTANLEEISTEKPQEQPLKQRETQFDEELIKTHRQAIIDDITKRQMAVGRPEEESRASGEIVARFMQTMSEMYGGARGTAADWYAKEGASVVPAKERAKVPELAQKGEELEQTARGKIKLATDNARALITMFKASNASTFMHESAHHFLDIMTRYAGMEDAPERLRNDVKTLHDYLGFKSIEDYMKGKDAPRGTPEWRNFSKAHERMARSFERYLMEGVAPSPEMAGVFEKFKRWMTDIYETVKNLRVADINDEIRDLFDRLLVREPQHTILSPEETKPRESMDISSHMASIHEADAEHTPPKQAESAADNIQREIKKTAEAHKGAKDAIETAEKIGASESNPVQPQPVTAEPTGAAAGSEIPEQPSALGGGAGETKGEGDAERGKPGEQPGQPELRNAEAAREQPQGEPVSPTERFGESKPYYMNEKGVINFDLFKTPEDIQNYLQEWADKNPDKIAQARGGVVTLDNTVQLAESLGMTTRDLLARKVGELYDGPQQVAAAQLFIQSSKRIKDMADAARASGDPQKVIDFFNSLEDHKDFMDMFLQQVGISAEASRALGSRRAIRKLEGFGEAMQIGELFQKISGVALKDAKSMADAFAALDTPAKVSKMAQDSRNANWFDYLIAYRNNNLLSGPITHLYYTMGNLVNILYKPAKVAVASLMEGGPKLGEAGAMYNSLVMGATNGLQAAKAAWRDGVDRSFQTQIEGYKRPTRVEFNPIFNKLFNVSSRAISSIHTLTYSMRLEQEKAALGFRQALKEGLQENTSDFNNRVTDLQVNPTPEIMEAAAKTARTEGYMGNFEYNSTMGKITDFANRTAVGRFFFPFAKMELNVKRESFINNTVIGLLSKDVQATLRGENGPEAKAIQIAGMGMGTSLIGAVWAMGDAINGNGPSDPNQRKVWLLTHTPNSVQIGGVAIPLRALGNLGQLLMAGAEIKETFFDMKEDDADKAAAIFMEHASRVAFQGTFIQNAQETISAFFNPKQYFAQFVRNQAGGFVPYSTLLSQTNRYIDPYRREIPHEGLTGLYGITDAIKAHIPGLSQTIQPQIDVMGNPIPSDHWAAAGSYDKYASDPIVQKLMQIGAAIGKPERNIMGVPLTPQQYNDFAVTRGHALRESLEWRLNDPEFDQLPHADQLKEVHKASAEATRSASSAIMFEHPEIMDKAIAKKEQSVFH